MLYAKTPLKTRINGATSAFSNCGAWLSVLGVQASPLELAGQIDSVSHVATRFVLEDNLSSRDAWMQAAASERKRGGVLNALSSVPSPLMQLIVRLWAAGGSTSGVEQSFGKSHCHSVDMLTIDTLNGRMDVHDFPREDVKQAIELARTSLDGNLWASSYIR